MPQTSASRTLKKLLLIEASSFLCWWDPVTLIHLKLHCNKSLMLFMHLLTLTSIGLLTGWLGVCFKPYLMLVLLDQDILLHCLSISFALWDVHFAWLKSYLSECHMIVSLVFICSHEVPVKCGVPGVWSLVSSVYTLKCWCCTSFC